MVQLLDPNGPYVADAASDGIDPSSNAVEIDSSGTLIPNGTIVTYHKGGPDTAIGGLQDGVSYQAVVDPSDPSTIHLVTTGANAGQTVQLTATATLVTGGGLSYTITTVNGLIQTLTVTEPQGASGPTHLTAGEAVTYNGALGASVPGLVDGQTYYVSIPDPTYPTVIELNDSPAGSSTPEGFQSLAGSSTPEGFQPISLFGNVGVNHAVGSHSKLSPAQTEGITVAATLTSYENLAANTGTGDSPPILNLAMSGMSLGQGDSMGAKIKDLNGPRSSLKQAFNKANLSSLGNAPTGLGSLLNGYFGMTASYIGEDVSNNVIAEVGKDAVLQSQSNITVNSNLQEDNQTSDDATFCKVTPSPGTNQEGQKSNDVDLAVAVVTDLLNNTAQALIDGGSQVDAAAALSVTAQVTYPWAEPINLSGLESPSTWEYEAVPEVWALVSRLADGTLGLDSLVNNWADAAAESSSDQNCISGSVNFTDYTNDCQAQIGAGALINQDPQQYQNSAQSVAVDATTNFQAVNFLGNTSFGFTPSDLIMNYKLGGSGQVLANIAAPTEGSVSGIGASLTLVFMNNTTEATIGAADGSDITTPTKVNFGSGGLDVNATQFVLNIDLATSGGIIGTSGLGMGGQLGANGSVSWFAANTTTIAQIASGSIVTGVSGGAVNVDAGDEMYLIGVGGAAAMGANIGIGVSIVVNDVTRTTEAIIGASIDPTSSTTPPPSDWNVAGPVTVEASENGSIYMLRPFRGGRLSFTASRPRSGARCRSVPRRKLEFGRFRKPERARTSRPGLQRVRLVRPGDLGRRRVQRLYRHHRGVHQRPRHVRDCRADGRRAGRHRADRRRRCVHTLVQRPEQRKCRQEWGSQRLIRRERSARRDRGLHPERPTDGYWGPLGHGQSPQQHRHLGLLDRGRCGQPELGGRGLGRDRRF